jgi:uncharacterized membrane protein
MDGIFPERLGNLHLVLLHLPIGFVVAAVLLEFWRWRRPSTDGAWLHGRLLATNALASVLAAATGLILASTGGYSEDLLSLHRWAGVGCAGLAIAAWLAHERGGPALARGTLAALFLATVVTGHLGATLTHGPGVTAWWGLGAKPAAEPPASARFAGTPFGDTIAPILERSCLECHGPAKNRGRLRLDTRAAALAGGKSGRPGIAPGDPALSEVLRRVKLPREHDDAMPPEDMPGLSPDEIAVLETWIATGAPWR